MFKITINHVSQIHEFEELINLFLRTDSYKILNNGTITDNLKTLGNKETIEPGDKSIYVPDMLTLHLKDAEGRNKVKQFLFDQLTRETGIIPPWGIHTGVRPVKMVFELKAKEGSLEKARTVLEKYYRMSPAKVDLLMEIYKVQSEFLKPSDPLARGLYIGIPFCPTRCSYCSFPANQGKKEEIEEYLNTLLKEITFVAEEMKRKNLYPESIYLGGGTPTILKEKQLERLLEKITDSFDVSKLKEFSLEAGRPETITREKLKTAEKYGISRISINPQSMKEETLQTIGRAHLPDDIVSAFHLAKENDVKIINSDLIAGLPGEKPMDFRDSLEKIIALGAENITVHTLAIKRTSRLKEMDEEFHKKQGEIVGEMLAISRSILKKEGYHPYYLYRQKQMFGNFENVGYAKPGTENIYNIRTMEEAQTIIAMGAGGITKVYYPAENRLERVPNVSNFEIYIERIDEMIQRKKENLF